MNHKTFLILFFRKTFFNYFDRHCVMIQCYSEVFYNWGEIFFFYVTQKKLFQLKFKIISNTNCFSSLKQVTRLYRNIHFLFIWMKCHVTTFLEKGYRIVYLTLLKGWDLFNFIFYYLYAEKCILRCASR